MTKTIILVQGPGDGRIEQVPADKKEFITVHNERPTTKVMLTVRTGLYLQTGEYDGFGRELFLWQGWQDLQNNG